MSGATDVPLASAGIREARELAEHLIHESPCARLYSSPLQRALDTACIIAQRCKLELHIATLLAEINCGDADGLRLSEVQQRYPDHWRRNLDQSDPDFCWPGGESYRQFRERAIRGLRQIARNHAGERLLVVTHSGVISQVIGWVLGTSPASWGEYRPRTGSITELHWSNSHVSVRRFDELPPKRIGDHE